MPEFSKIVNTRLNNTLNVATVNYGKWAVSYIARFCTLSAQSIFPKDIWHPD